MNEIIHSFEKVNQSNKIKENKNQNDFNNIKNDDELSPFIVRKTEIIDIYLLFYIRNKWEIRRKKNNLEFNNLFDIKDIEVAYDISPLSLTVIDQQNNNKILGFLYLMKHLLYFCN